MRISDWSSDVCSSDLMATLSAHADTLQAQISTTKKYAAPSDNIIAYQRLQGIARTGADASAYATNIQLAQTLLGQSDATLAGVLDQVQRARNSPSRRAATPSPLERQSVV